MGQIINNTVRQDGEKIDLMLQKQEQHKDHLENHILVDLKETDKYQGKMNSKCLYFGLFLVFTLLGCLLVLYFKLRPGSKVQEVGEQKPVPGALNEREESEIADMVQKMLLLI